MSVNSVIAVLLTSLLLVACAPVEPPSDFETGEETTPPYGCIEYRTRGGDC